MVHAASGWLGFESPRGGHLPLKRACLSLQRNYYSAAARGHCPVTFRRIVQLLRHYVRIIMYAWWKLVIWLLMIYVLVGTLAQAYTWNTAMESLDDCFVATPWWWVASIWVAWQMLVGSYVSICATENEWHDRRDQHGCMLDQMCRYAPIQKYELLKIIQAGNVWIIELWNEPGALL